MTYLFELDGTLIDSLPGIAEALSRAFATLNLPFPQANLRAAIGPPIRIIARTLDPTLTDTQTQAIEHLYRPLYDQQTYRLTTLFPTVRETLTTLAQHHTLHLVTNKPTLPTENILTHLNLSSLFTKVLTRDHHPTKAAMVAALHPDPLQTIMVGDTAEDAQAAALNQIPFVFANYGYGQAPTGTRTINSLQELLTR